MARGERRTRAEEGDDVDVVVILHGDHGIVQLGHELTALRVPFVGPVEGNLRYLSDLLIDDRVVRHLNAPSSQNLVDDSLDDECGDLIIALTQQVSQDRLAVLTEHRCATIRYDLALRP